MDQKRDLFISYHTESSKAIVEKIALMMEERGISCWYAPRDCQESWADAILNAIDKASMFLVIINEQSMNSEHVKNEINAAFSRYCMKQLAIVPFKIDNSKITAATEYYLGRIHMVNGFEPPFEDRLCELANRIAYMKLHAEDSASLSEFSKFKSATITPSLCFIGRKEEMALLDSNLEKYKKVFVSGMGGIGKSELVKEYLIKNKEKFRSVMHATYTTSIKDLIVNDNTLGISNFFRNPPDESDDSYFDRKIRFIESNGTFEDVLVIDNFNVKDDEHLSLLMSLPISIIFTSRNTYEDYCNLRLDVINNEDDLLAIFKKHYPKELNDDDLVAVKRIFDLVGNHTLTITIIANMMKKQRIHPRAMVESLEQNIQYGIESQKDVNNMIASVFEMSNVTEDEKYVLQNLTLVPTFGISAETFFEYCDLDSYDVIDELISKNLVLHDSARDYISLHPVVYRTVAKLVGYDDETCANYLSSIISLLNNAKYIEHQRRERILETIAQIARVIPKTSRYYVQFYLACGQAYHAFAKHNLTIEKLEALNNDDISIETRVEALTDIADAYRCMEQMDGLWKKANEAMSLCEKMDQNATKTKKLKSELLGRFGWYYHGIKNHSESLKYFEEQLEIVLNTDNETDERIGWAYFNVALAKRCLNEYSEATASFVRALEYFEKIKMDFAIANTYKEISECYTAVGDYEKSLDYLTNTLNMFKNLLGEMHNDTAGTKHYISMVYLKMGDLDTATKFHNEAIECIEKLGCYNIAQNWIGEFNRDNGKK